jgi:hypothetical protein
VIIEELTTVVRVESKQREWKGYSPAGSSLQLEPFVLIQYIPSCHQ